MHILLIISCVALIISICIQSIIHWNYYTPGIIDEPAEEYDYIIVGAGTAGCVIARRLSEKCNCSILIVEAGDVPSWFTSVPFLAPTLQLSSLDWAYKTVSQKQSQWGMNNRTSFWPRGKSLGGSSAINYLLHMWGAKTDFVKLSEATGDPEWTFESVKDYFQKSQIILQEKFRQYSRNKGYSGFLPVTQFLTKSSKLSSAFLSTMESFGLKIGNLNGQLDTGAMAAYINTEFGKRVSTFDAYLRPVLGKYNIRIMIKSIVTKIIFKDNIATGVLVQKAYSSYIVTARKQVILCAGSIGSPHILLLSGIGPVEQLEKHGIPVVADLAGVGQNLRDHLNLPMYFDLKDPLSLTLSKLKSVGEVVKYLWKGTGYFSHGGVEIIVRFRLQNSSSDEPDAYFMLFNVGSVDKSVFQTVANLQEKTFSECFPGATDESKEGFFILVTCAHPKSVGQLVLANSDPFTPPLIDPHYLEDRNDVECFQKAIRVGAEMGSSKPFKDFGSRLNLPKFEHCSQNSISLEDNDYLECWLRTSAMTAYHPMGTCSMGKDGDPLAVLNSRFQLRQVKQLRVVDASAIPITLSATPHATVVMMAEKAAQWILDDT